MAIAALALGVVGVFTIWFLFGIPCAVLAIVLGVLAKDRADHRRGMALAGIWLGVAGLLLFAGLIALELTS